MNQLGRKLSRISNDSLRTKQLQVNGHRRTATTGENITRGRLRIKYCTRKVKYETVTDKKGYMDGGYT